EYPAYIERAPLTIDSVSGAVPVRVPIGSRIMIRGKADKPLEMARIDCPASESSPAWHQEFQGNQLGAERNEFTYSIEPFPGLPKEIHSATNSSEKGAVEPVLALKPPHECTLQFTLRDT